MLFKAFKLRPSGAVAMLSKTEPVTVPLIEIRFPDCFLYPFLNLIFYRLYVLQGQQGSILKGEAKLKKRSEADVYNVSLFSWGSPCWTQPVNRTMMYYRSEEEGIVFHKDTADTFHCFGFSMRRGEPKRVESVEPYVLRTSYLTNKCSSGGQEIYTINLLQG